MRTHNGSIDYGIEIPRPSAALRGVIKNELRLRKLVDAPEPEDENKRLLWEQEVIRIQKALRHDERQFHRETLYYRLACSYDGIRRLNAAQSRVGFNLRGKNIAEFTRANLLTQITEIEAEITAIEDELSLKSRLKKYGENLLMENPLAAGTPDIQTPVWGANR